MKLSSWLQVLLVVIPSVLFAQTGSDFPSGAHNAVRCMFALTSPNNCASLPKVVVPSYLLQEYDNGPVSLHQALLKNSLAQLPDDQVSNIPLSLLYLIPRARLADLKVNQLRAILLKHASDTSLVHQLATCLHFGNAKLEFIKQMNISLPEDSLQVLAESLEISDLTESFFNVPFVENEPLAAYLRPAVLFNLETSILHTIFNILQMSENPPKKSAYYFLVEAALRHKITLSKLEGYVLGLSSDKLLDDSLSFDDPVSDFKLDLSVLQARALFKQTYKDTLLSSSNFIDSKPLLYKLSPELLQKFPQNVQKYDVNYIEPSSIPLPTACQITEYVKADCILTSKLPKDEDEFWDFHIRHLGKWVYTLPLSALEGYKSSILNTPALKTIESPAISPLQAYYLTSKGEALDVSTPNTVLDLETFLHALPASQLVNRKLGDISLQVILHLVSKLPANNLARTLSLVNRIASSIGDSTADDNAGDSSVLEELLGNRDVNQIMTLLSPKDLALSAEAILKFFNENRIRNTFQRTVEQLPQPILAALLHQDRLTDPNQWRWSKILDNSQVSHLLIGGLTCQDIEEMDTGLFVPIMYRYNAIRKMPFPKNLQHCCVQKLINHLKLKMALTQAEADLGLISLLEPIEIESIGGFVLVHIPLDAMKVSPYLGQILSKIGQLTNVELMLSTDISRLKQIAELAIDKDSNVDTYLIRNLVWFLTPNSSTPDLRLMLEAELLDTTICLPTEARQHVAIRLLSAFGPPEQWSAGVLATLQDLLIVFSDEELSRIPQTSWAQAADSFHSHYADLVDWIEVSAFYKVCANILGKLEGNNYKKAISHYVHWRLKAAQWLLDTVVPIPQPEVTKPSTSHSHNNFDKQDEESEATLSVFAPEVDTETDTEKDDEDLEDREETSSISSTMSTEESTTDESTTETTEGSTTQEAAAENIIKHFVEELKTEESTTTRDSTSKKNPIHTHSTQETITLSNVPKYYLPEKTYGGRDVTTETYITGKTEEIVSNMSTTTQKYVSLNSSSTLITNYNNSKTENSTVEHESTKEMENLAPCINSVNKEDCENYTSTSFSKPNKISVTQSGEVTTSKIYLSGFHRSSNFSLEYPSNFSSFQNTTVTSSKTSTNQSIYLKIVDSGKTVISTVKSIANETKDDKGSKISTSSHKPYTKSSFAESINNMTSTFSSNKTTSASTLSQNKNNTLQVNSQINLSNATVQEHSSPEKEYKNGDDEEEIIYDDIDNDGILVPPEPKPSKRNKRSFFQQTSGLKLSCNAIKMVGSLSELTLTTSDVNEMSANDIADCRMEFGYMELNEQIQKIIWKRMETKVKLDGIHLLGRLLRALSVADLWDIDFRASNPWVLETIHAILRYNNNTMVVKKLIENVAKYNAEYSVDLLTVLGPSVCSLEVDSLRALSVVGLDLGPSCPPCLPYLAERAIEELKSVDSWTLHFVHSLQAIVAGLDLESWSQLAASPHKPLAGLQPSAARCLNTSHLQVLSPDQIRMIPSATLLSLSEYQLAAFNSTQLATVQNITHPSIAENMTPTMRVHTAGFPSGKSNQLLPTLSLITCITILNFLFLYKI